MAKKRYDDRGTGIPLHEVIAIAETLFPDIIAYFESEQGRREFEEWEKQQDKQKE